MTAGGYLGNKGAFLFIFKGIDIPISGIVEYYTTISSTMPFYFSLQGNGVNRTIFLGGFDLYLRLTFFWPFCVFLFFLSF